MKKEYYALIVISFLVITAISAYAAGSATAQGENVNQEELQESNNLCDQTSLKERFKCRLETSKQGPETPEACQQLSNQEFSFRIKKSECIDFYEKTGEKGRDCYSKTGKTKGECFLTESGMIKSAKRTTTADQKSLRKYMVILLYDLQERCELAYQNGETDSEKTSTFIDMIVKAKVDIMNGIERDQIRIHLDEIKSRWSELCTNQN